MLGSKPRFTVSAARIAGLALFLIGGAAGQEANRNSTWLRIAPAFHSPDESAKDLGRYRSPLLFEDGHAVKTAEDWSKRREEINRGLRTSLSRSGARTKDPELLVLCGHTHGSGQVHVLDNLRVLTGESRLLRSGDPRAIGRAVTTDCSNHRFPAGGPAYFANACPAGNTSTDSIAVSRPSRPSK